MNRGIKKVSMPSKIMNEKDSNPDDMSQPLPVRWAAQAPDSPERIPPEAVQEAFSRLQACQIELETKNEELRQARAELKAAQARYADLYDLAPVGHATIDESRRIVAANQTLAGFVGEAKEALVNQPIDRYISPDDRDTFAHHCQQLFDTGASHACELRLLQGNGRFLWVQSEGVVSQPEADGSPICYLVISNITRQKQTEQALRESEEIFNQFMEHSPIYVFFKDKDTRSIRLSRNYERMLGRPVSELLGKTMDDLFPSDLAKNMMADDLRVLHEGKQIEIEEELDGRFYLTTKFPIISEGQAHYLAGFTIDITERKQAELFAQYKERRLKEAEAIAHFGYYELDIQTGEVIWSDETFRIFGLNLADGMPTGDQFVALIHPEDMAEVLGMFADAIQSGRPFDHIYRIRHASGEVRTVHSMGSLDTDPVSGSVKMFGTLHDITEQKRSEIALQQSENRFRALIENAPDAINLIDAEGRLTYVSPSALRLLGYTIADIQNTNMAALTHPDDVTAVITLLIDLIQEPGKVATTQYRFRHKDGSWRWLESTISNLLTEPGVEGILFNFRDITQQKQAEESARRQSEQIRLLYDASQRLNRTLDINEIYQTIFEFLSAILPCDGLIISAFDPSTELITCQAHWVGRGEAQDVSAYPPIPLEPEGRGTQSLAIRTGKPLLLNDYVAQRKTTQTIYFIDDETNEVVLEDELPEDGDITRSALIVPLKTGEQVNGVIQVMSYQLNAYTENHLKLLEALALHINSAQTNARLFAQVQSELNERKLAEAALRENAEKFRTVAEFTYDWEYWVGLDGRYRYISPACERITGYSVQEFLEDDTLLNKLVHPDDLEKVTSHLHDIQTAAAAVMDFRILTRQGEVRWINHVCQPVYADDGTWLGRRASNRDVTDSKKAAEALRESEEKLRLLFDILPVGVAILDKSRNLVYMNPALADIMVISDVEMRKGDYRNRVYLQADGSPMPPEALASRRAVRTQQSVQHVETGVVIEDGTVIWTDVSAVPVAFPDWNVVIVTMNITERKRAEEALRENHRHLEAALAELQQTQTQLIQQERLAAVGQLAAGIAHDFNNILAIIMLYAEMSLTAPNLPAELYTRMGTIVRQTERAAYLVQQILDFGRRAILQPHSLDLASFLREQVELWQRTIPEFIRIRLNMAAGEYFIHADPTRIQQVFINLVLNARDAMPDGGELRLSLEGLHLDEAMTPPMAEMQAGDWVKIVVQDTGIGISQEALPHIYEPFFTTKEPGKGSGLGLAQVYGIIKQHNGHIDVWSESGRGTSFIIYLPAVRVTPAADTAVAAPDVRLGNGETVLIVEDNATLREALASMLSMLNYNPLTAANGREALALLRQQADNAQTGAPTTDHDIALVLSDLVMPEIGGKELLETIQQWGLRLPVVILSGHPMEAEAQMVKSHYAAGWLLKPFDFQQLANMLAQVLSSH